MANMKYDPERVRIIRELLLEAESDTPHTVTDAVARRGAVAYLQTKLKEAGRVQLNGD